VEWEIKRYDDPLQPLIQTDLMKVAGEDLVKRGGDEVKSGKLLGLAIGFTLPPSSYATIALRELMKRPTASEYQKELKLEGSCESFLVSAAKPKVSVERPVRKRQAAAIVVGKSLK